MADALRIMLENEPRFIHSRDEEGRTPLHFAAYMGYLEEVNYLLNNHPPNSLQRDKNGQLPIHLASMEGHIHVIQRLLEYYYDPNEVLNSDHQNILHVAAESGKYDVVMYILQNPNLEELINDKDKDGNTPLHLASMCYYPKIVNAFTWDERVDLTIINNKSLTALDAAEAGMKEIPPFNQRLTWSALKAAGALRASSDKFSSTGRKALMQWEPPKTENYKERVNTLMLVSALVATVTFAAGFTMPGGYNDSKPNEGMAIMLEHGAFSVFVFSNTIAMYSSIIVAVTLIWAQLGDFSFMVSALGLAIPLLGIALGMMSIAFTAGTYLVVSKLSWLAIASLVMGSFLLLIIAALFIPLCFRVASQYYILRFITFYLICLASLITGSS